MTKYLKAFALSLVLTSCGRTTSSSELLDLQPPKPRFDVNDVSLLWPLPEKYEHLSQLLILEGSGLLSTENFQRLLDIAKFEDDPGYAYWRMKYWYVIGMRFDPCAKVMPTDTTCGGELKLIAQPLGESSSGRITASDDALHLIYHLNSEQILRIARKLYELKTMDAAISTNGAALNIHPIMAAQGLEGAFAKGLRTLVIEFAQEGNLKEATAMLRLNANEWRFARSLPNTAHELVGAPIPFVNGSVQTLFGERRHDGNPGIFNEIRPQASGADSLNEAVDSDAPVGGFFKLSPEEQGDLLQAALRIDNPLVHTPSTIDCVSCHVASRVLARVKGKDYLEARDGNVDRYVPPMPMTLRNETEDREITLGYTSRAFGYGLMGPRDASTTQRVINDSARVASDLNTRYLPYF